MTRLSHAQIREAYEKDEIIPVDGFRKTKAIKLEHCQVNDEQFANNLSYSNLQVRTYDADNNESETLASLGNYVQIFG